MIAVTVMMVMSQTMIAATVMMVMSQILATLVFHLILILISIWMREVAK